MRLLICYDVVDDRRRTKLAQLLEDHGTRVQYSVFEVTMSEPQLVELQRRMTARIDQTEDSIRIYRLCSRCQAGLDVIGCGPFGGPDRVSVL